MSRSTSGPICCSLVGLLILLWGASPTARAEVPLDAAGQAVQRLLADPTTRAVVVDFYGTWCGPCQPAIGELARLQDEYGPRGLRLVVVTVESEGAVTRADTRGPTWRPTEIVRDDDRSLMARWGLRDLPASFLFTWSRGLTPVAQAAGLGGSQQVGHAVTAFYREALKMLVEPPIDCRDRPLPGGDGKSLALTVQGLMLGLSRFDVVADDAALQGNIRVLVRQARELKKEAETCPVDRMVPANSRLVVRHCPGSGTAPGKLWLELLPLAQGCRAALVSADVHQGLVQAAAPLAVQALLTQLGSAAVPLARGTSAAGSASPPATTGISVSASVLAPPAPAVAPTRPLIIGGSETAATGNLAVEVKPFGQVRLELTDPAGKALPPCGSPYRNPQALVGTWQLVATAEGHEATRQPFLVPPDETTVVKLALRPLGVLEVTGTPAGATIQVTGPDGFSDRRGLPWSAVGLKQGAYRVEVSRTGYWGLDREVMVQPGQTARLEVALDRELTAAVPAAAPPPSIDRWGITWVAQPGGSFDMGSIEGDADEQPVHRVTVRPFQLMRTEITVAMYRECVAAGKCSEQGLTCSVYSNWDPRDRGQHPMNCIDWEQAQAFCAAVGGRLPSEAEWEYAAGSGKGWTYPWGNAAPNCDRAIMAQGGDGCGKDRTWAVCSREAGNSQQGLCDQAGNVWEWVADGYHDSYQDAPTDGSARVSPAGSDRVFRGGGWYDRAESLRAASRGRYTPVLRGDDLGARCAR